MTAYLSWLIASCSVGLGSDFDGIGDVPVGLEDVSKYPALVSVTLTLESGLRRRMALVAHTEICRAGCRAVPAGLERVRARRTDGRERAARDGGCGARRCADAEGWDSPGGIEV